MTTDRLLFRDRETGIIYEGARNVNTSLTRQIVNMGNSGFEYLGPTTHTAVGTGLNVFGVGDLLTIIYGFNCDFRLTIENGKITRYSCTYMGGD